MLGQSWKGRQPLRWLALANINACGPNIGDVWMGSIEAVLAGRCQWQKLLCLSAEQISVNYQHSLCVSANSVCFAPLFLAVTTLLSFASLGGMKPKEGLCTERLAVHPTLPFLMRGALYIWEVPPWQWTVTAWEMWWCWRNEIIILVYVIILFFVLFCFYSMVLLKFPKWALEMFWIYFSSWKTIQSLIFVGGMGNHFFHHWLLMYVDKSIIIFPCSKIKSHDLNV